MQTDHEIYPMPLFPQLTVSDIEESTEWYQALGFEVIYSMPVMTHIRYRKYADVMLVTDQTQLDVEQPPELLEENDRGQGVTHYITVEDESVDDVAERATEYGATLSYEPHETSWNTREVVIEDPDGYELAFSEPVDTERTIEDIMELTTQGQ
jgi:predicted lactoylglutathione lyase